jgi:carbonic anhydrase
MNDVPQRPNPSCSTLLIRCIDFRLDSAISDFLHANSLDDDADILSVAGSIQTLASNEEPGRRFMEEQVDVSKRMHGIRRVILINHTDCGAYGGRAAFESDEEETRRHTADMSAVEIWLKETYPGLIVEKQLARIEADGSVHIKHV